MRKVVVVEVEVRIDHKKLKCAKAGGPHPKCTGHPPSIIQARQASCSAIVRSSHVIAPL